MPTTPFDPIDGGPCATLAEAAVHARRPFVPDVVQARIWTQTEAGVEVAFYVDARVVIDRLNILLPGRWKAEFDVIDRRADGGQTVLVYRCRLTIDGCVYIDVGEGHDHKSGRSDAIKRAAVQIGIGHCLYRIPRLIMVGGPGRSRLRGEPGLYALDDANRLWLRRYYRRWLIETGVAEYGLPLDHGRAARSVAPELFPDDVRALLGTPERRGRRPRIPLAKGAATTHPATETHADTPEPPPTDTSVPPDETSPKPLSSDQAPASEQAPAPGPAPTPDTASAPTPEMASPPRPEPVSDPTPATRPPEPGGESDQLALAPAPATVAAASTPANEPTRLSPTPTVTEHAPEAPPRATTEQLAVLINRSREHGLRTATLGALVTCVAGCRLDELTERGLHTVRSFLDTVVAAGVEDSALAGALREIEEHPVYGTAPRDRLAAWLLEREEEAAAAA